MWVRVRETWWTQGTFVTFAKLEIRLRQQKVRKVYVAAGFDRATRDGCLVGAAFAFLFVHFLLVTEALHNCAARADVRRRPALMCPKFNIVVLFVLKNKNRILFCDVLCLSL